ncbi:hypothetical protein C5C03_00550 [Clavibacter michiganensis]|uniref:hypothetical protein n=1 Tax=Clavibacter michiganensis TaxID=28447 RepID=UPI000CE82FAA|nr:hypothetical protein [Clavibacter michiganensis]PPF91345.1 hypothetical protein C5C03_00550 [Clavibacter michiganensis]PPF99387.1 hypothetical protein C5C05_02350 [Clavibacter michiganensis]
MDTQIPKPRGPRHTEVHTTENGDAVTLACRCRLGRDHTYVEWLRLPENSEHLAEARNIWTRMAH